MINIPQKSIDSTEINSYRNTYIKTKNQSTLRITQSFLFANNHLKTIPTLLGTIWEVIKKVFGKSSTIFHNYPTKVPSLIGIEILWRMARPSIGTPSKNRAISADDGVWSCWRIATTCRAYRCCSVFSFPTFTPELEIHHTPFIIIWRDG